MKKLKILYVDDEIDNQIVFKSLLKKEFEIITESSGEKALQILQQTKFDVLITDQRMPGLTGSTLLKQSIPIQKDIFRVILTGFMDVKDVIDAINEGRCHAYLTKPFNKEDILYQLNALVQLTDRPNLNDKI